MSGLLQGKVAVVTGASSGLGRGFSHVIAAAGASVALMARRTDRLASEVAAIEQGGGRAIAIALDVADPNAVPAALARAQAVLSPISILVNNAGVGGDGLALDLPVEAWNQTFDVNVRGVYFAAREAARLMIDSGVAAAGDGRIINIASIAAYTALPGFSSYAASKAAVAMLTRSLAAEWARSLIAVNALCPGYIETEINCTWFAEEGGQKQIRGFPRRRLMPKEALDEALLLLAGPAARYMTGSLLTMDDGQLL